MGFLTMELSGKRRALNVHGVVTSGGIITANPKSGKAGMGKVKGEKRGKGEEGERESGIFVPFPLFALLLSRFPQAHIRFVGCFGEEFTDRLSQDRMDQRWDQFIQRLENKSSGLHSRMRKRQVFGVA